MLLTMLMKWPVQEGNVFVWTFALFVWNLLAWSINIDSVALYSIKRGISDFINFEYDETKVDKTDKFVCKKTVYSNQYDPFIFLCCCLSINSEMFEGSEPLFIAYSTKNTNTSQNFACQADAVGVCHAGQIKSFLHLSHLNIHGEKGQ